MTDLTRMARLLVAGLAGLGGLAACSDPPNAPNAERCEPAAVRSGARATPRAVVVAPRGTAATLDVGSWNIEWFGDTRSGFGPADDALQLEHARDVLAGTDADVWGVQEIVSQAQWDALEARLPGYAGFLAGESLVADGPSFYSPGEQKVGILYKTSVATLLGARLILTSSNAVFAGRPPLEVRLRVTVGGATRDVVVIVLHMKAFADEPSWQQRESAAAALKTYLDATYPSAHVLVIGDFNDDLDVSITPGRPSPYRHFVSDAARYRFPTKALSDAGITSLVFYPDIVDHHLATNEMAAGYVAGSAEVYRVDQVVPNYSATTSDHYPVLTRYTLDGSQPPPPPPPAEARVIINEVLANEPGRCAAAEFVELVNIGAAAADLGGWSLADASGVRHRFAAGTSLGAGRAVVVFGGASAIPAGLANAVAASAGPLGLADEGDRVELRDAGSAVRDAVAYLASHAREDGVSMNRSPDATASAAFVPHTRLGSRKSSPGARADGSGF